jgi:hypothetical protein
MRLAFSVFSNSVIFSWATDAILLPLMPKIAKSISYVAMASYIRKLQKIDKRSENTYCLHNQPGKLISEVIFSITFTNNLSLNVIQICAMFSYPLNIGIGLNLQGQIYASNLFHAAICENFILN